MRHGGPNDDHREQHLCLKCNRHLVATAHCLGFEPSDAEVKKAWTLILAARVRPVDRDTRRVLPETTKREAPMTGAGPGRGRGPGRGKVKEEEADDMSNPPRFDTGKIEEEAE